MLQGLQSDNFIQGVHDQGVKFFKKPKRKQLWLKFFTGLVWFLVAVIALLMINIWLAFPIVNKIYQHSSDGKVKLELSLYYFSQRQFAEAGQNLQEAEADLTIAVAEMKKLRLTPMAYLPYVRERLIDLDKLLGLALQLTQTGQELNTSMNDILRIIPDYSLPNYNRLNEEQKKLLWQTVYETAPQLTSAKQNLMSLTEQLQYLANLNIVKYYKIDLVAIDKRLQEVIVSLNQAEIFARILPQVVGYPETARYLLVLQNNHELRPTGGFIGTIGVAEVTAGNISKLTTSDVYHFDMPASGKLRVVPPAPIKKYLKVDYWYMRDANWSPDWPTSAEKIKWFYGEENKYIVNGDKNAEFDFVLGITPDLIIDLMELTGTIKVDGQLYTAENFMELLQETTEKTYQQKGIRSWDRKQVIGKLATIMQERIISQLDSRRQDIIDIFQKNLNEKNLLVYSEDANIKSYLRGLNWDGQVLNTENDYLLVVDANLAALKTDAVINRNIDYSLEETDKGVVARLRINYANTGSFTWKTTRYQSFTRIFVPKGSKLIKAAGFYGDPKDIVVGEDLDKTYFGGYLEIEPGNIGGLTFEYYLPDNVWQRIRANGYELDIQKQPGNNTQDLRVSLKFINQIKSYEPNSLHTSVNGNEISWKDNLSTDKNFSVSLY